MLIKGVDQWRQFTYHIYLEQHDCLRVLLYLLLCLFKMACRGWELLSNIALSLSQCIPIRERWHMHISFMTSLSPPNGLLHHIDAHSNYNCTNKRSLCLLRQESALLSNNRHPSWWKVIIFSHTPCPVSPLISLSAA